MEKKTWISKLVDRLCQLPAQNLEKLVDAQAVRDEIGNAIKRAAKSEDHATRFVDRLVEGESGRQVWRPTAAEIRDAAAATSVEPPPKLTAANPNCPECSGSGFKTVYRNGFSGAAICECRRVPEQQKAS